MKRVFIVVPFNQLVDTQIPRYLVRELLLKREGVLVLNPSVLPLGLTSEEYAKICMALLSIAQEVHFLPGWESDRVSRALHAIAQTGEQVIHLDGLVSVSAHHVERGCYEQES